MTQHVDTRPAQPPSFSGEPHSTRPHHADSSAMSAGLPSPPPADGGAGTRPSEGWPDSTLNGRGAQAPSQHTSRWFGWRLRVLVLLTLLGCVGVFTIARGIAGQPWVDAVWRADVAGRMSLASTSVGELQPHQGRALLAVAGAGMPAVRTDALALQRSSRWLIDDAERDRHRVLHDDLHAALQSAPVTFVFDDGAAVDVQPRARGFSHLPAPFWLLLAFGLGLYLLAAVGLLAQPWARSWLYAVAACCQAGNFFLIAVETTLELGLPPPLPALDMPLRTALDLCTAAAIVHIACIYPRRLPAAGLVVAAAWVLAAVLTALVATTGLPGRWWWAQGSLTGFGLASIGLLTWSHRVEPHPIALLLRRFAMVMVGTWLLMTSALAETDHMPGTPSNLAAIASMVWYVSFGSLLLLAPFLSRSHLLLREFSLLAAVSAFATSLDLLFVSVFALGQFASLALSLVISLAGYSVARQWILNQLLGSSRLTTERMFEQLYRIARDVEARPERMPASLQRLLGELFDPIENRRVERLPAAAVVEDEGATLLVPMPPRAAFNEGDAAPAADAEAEAAPGSVMVRFAHRGRRLFTSDDARLADRVVEQLRRAVVFDKAVEQGRKEERLRLAQDLHDDIGARLLTIMYKSPTPEMEDYIRHTLKDLKTLTRGLAASSHLLSHSAAEWKADLAQRLLAAQIELEWSMSLDDDVSLGVVQWSALTRVVRELVSNAIAHSGAQRLDIEIGLLKDRFDLVITDDGVGRNPRAWSHGLGLGGVRKRVKQLGGEVEWREALPRGISCRVSIPAFSARR